MNDIASWINTVLLIIIFCYQWNKNRVLSTRINQQTKLLKETNLIITQQSTAIESQAKIVQSAMTYSEAFNPKKLEEIIRKEFEIENSGKIAEMERQYADTLAERDSKLENIVNKAYKTAVEASVSTINPLLSLIAGLMVYTKADIRDKVINELPEGSIKDSLMDASKKIESDYKRKAINTLLGQ